MRMPFRKFKGFDRWEPPEKYVFWLLGNIELRDPLLPSIRREVRRRTGTPICYSGKLYLTIETEDVGPLHEMVSAGCKDVTRFKHPDVGGSGVEMARLNLLAKSRQGQLSILGAG